MRRLSSWLIFPLFVGGSVVGLHLGLRTGVAPMIVLSAGAVVLAAIVSLLERALPYEQAWNAERGDRAADLWHLALNLLLLETVPPLLLASVEPLGAWPTAWPLAAQVLVALIAADIASYGVHRLLHGPLWRFHAVHHSAPRLYWINSWRLHPVEVLLYFAATVVPITLAGAPREVALVTVVATTAFRMLQHSNVDVRLGPLSWILAGAEVHRWHHVRDRRVADANFGGLFSLWDVLLGTFRPPRDRPPADVGIDEPIAADYLGQLKAPFARRD